MSDYNLIKLLAIHFLQDELQMTTRSYEGQMSMMSDHLAGMNEKLANQKEEIEALKHQLMLESKVKQETWKPLLKNKNDFLC